MGNNVHTFKLFFAGSGGQGILLMGRMIVKAAMLEDKDATFLPSYGPEMRGGTANCTVVVSDKEISCPLIYQADAVVAMNLPSLLKFESLVRPGGKLFINTTLIEQAPARGDIEIVEVPASEIANALGSDRAANMVMLGAVVRATGVVSMDAVERELAEIFSGRKTQLLALNQQALAAFPG